MNQKERIEKLDLLLNHFKELDEKGHLWAYYDLHLFAPTIGLEYGGIPLHKLEEIFIERGILDKKPGGLVITDFGRNFKGFANEAIDNMSESESMKLHRENIALDNKLKKAEEKIITLNHQLKWIELIKSYWYILLIGAAIFTAIGNLALPPLFRGHTPPKTIKLGE